MSQCLLYRVIPADTWISHIFSDAVAFEYVGGRTCQGQGASCMTPSFAFAYSSTDSKHAHSGSYADCKTAFKQPDDTCVQVGCSEDNVSVNPLQGMRDTDCCRSGCMSTSVQRAWALSSRTKTSEDAHVKQGDSLTACRSCS